jgi:Tfp pilus assembly protein PilF
MLNVGCKSVSENEQLADIHMRVGFGHLQNGNYPQALRELLIAEKLDENNPYIQNNLALAYFKRGRPDLAETHARKALTLNPKFSEARNTLMQVLTELQQFAEAEKQGQMVIDDLTYEHPEVAQMNMGILKFRMGKYSQAEGYFRKSLDYQKENCIVQTYYGRCFYELKQYSKATEVLDQAVGYCQRLQYDEPHYYSALSYFQKGSSDKAESMLKELIHLYPDGRYVSRAKEALEVIQK